MLYHLDLRIRVAFGLLLTIFAMMAVSCSMPTPYQAISSMGAASGGYAEQAIGPGHYNVTFSGNSLTSRERVERYLLFRAAELTVRDGYDGFRIVDRLVERDRETYVEPSPFHDPWYGYGWYRPSWRYYHGGFWTGWYPFYNDPFFATPGYSRSIERYEVHAEIVMSRGPIVHGKDGAFDARRLIAELGPTIEYPKD